MFHTHRLELDSKTSSINFTRPLHKSSNSTEVIVLFYVGKSTKSCEYVVWILIIIHSIIIILYIAVNLNCFMFA